jgi:hypothetical protein
MSKAGIALYGPRNSDESDAADLRGYEDERKFRNSGEHVKAVVVGEGPGEPDVVREFLAEEVVALGWEGVVLGRVESDAMTVAL